MFTPDQIVVYPAQGVGTVERLERRDIGGMNAEFYIIRILTNNITVMVPVNNAAAIGLRTLCSRQEAEEVLAFMRDRSKVSGHTGQNWNRRYREYTERLKSPSLFDVGHVLKELFLISAEKDLSFGERRLLEQAMSLVCSELSCVLQRDADDIKREIESFFADLLDKSEKNE